jgi:hypothetical protein
MTPRAAAATDHGQQSNPSPGGHPECSRMIATIMIARRIQQQYLMLTNSPHPDKPEQDRDDHGKKAGILIAF